MRTIIDLTPKQLEGLERIRRRKNVSRAAVLREAVDEKLAREEGDGLDGVFGVLSKDKADRMRAAIAELRSEWDDD
jgi:hypothetical protein